MSGSVLQHILDTAIAAGTGARVDVPAGNYTFAPATSLRIVGAENLTVSAVPPATLLFACGDGVHIANSSFVSFINFTIDYPSPCFAQGKVTVAPPASSPRSRNYTGAPNETVTVTFDTEHFPSPEDILRLAGNGQPPQPLRCQNNFVNIAGIVGTPAGARTISPNSNVSVRFPPSNFHRTRSNVDDVITCFTS